MKLYLLRFLTVTFCAGMLFCPAAAENPSGGAVRKIVIDPGHGGKHPGTNYKGIMEKDITLKVALLLGDMIKANFPDVEVIYTRTTDKYVDLADRGDIANKAGADLFLSIHVDAVGNTSVGGNSSWIMGMDKSSANLDVAMRENDVVSLEEDYTTKYEGYVPGSPESFIIFSLMQYAYQDQSMLLAETIQKHYRQTTPLKDRGARMGPYLVLWRTAMPSVLTEIGFLSNESDRKFLTSAAGQKKIATALFNAFSEYKSKTEGRSQTIFMKDDAAQPAQVPASARTAAPEPAPTPAPAPAEDKGIKFYVQLCTVSARKSPDSRDFGSFRGKVVERRTPKGLYQYFAGGTPSWEGVLDLQAAARKEFRDAFVVAYRNDKPIAVAEAKRLLGIK